MSAATDRQQALCCECGTLRMLGGRHPARVADTSGPDGSTGVCKRSGWRNGGLVGLIGASAGRSV